MKKNTIDFNGSSDYLSITDTEDWNFGTISDFTVSSFIRFSTHKLWYRIWERINDYMGRKRFYILKLFKRLPSYLSFEEYWDIHWFDLSALKFVGFMHKKFNIRLKT